MHIFEDAPSLSLRSLQRQGGDFDFHVLLNDRSGNHFSNPRSTATSAAIPVRSAGSASGANSGE